MLPDRCELVDGEIIEMPGQNYLAVAVIIEVIRYLSASMGSGFFVATHLTHPFRSGWNPMPDVSLYDRRPPVSPRAGDFPPPRLIVEVSDSTLDYDLGDKLRRYAEEGVEEVWVADATNRRLHVSRRTGEDGRTVRVQSDDDTIAPLCLPDLPIRVGDLFPPSEDPIVQG
jgi:Uma2 family endonuclease